MMPVMSAALVQQSASPPQAPTGDQTIIRTLPNGDVTVITPDARTAPPASTEVAPPWAGLSEQATTMISLGFLAVVALVLFPIVRAVARRIEGRGQGAPSSLDGELAELRSRVHMLEEQQMQMHEIAERLDFAERLLSRSEAEKVR